MIQETQMPVDAGPPPEQLAQLHVGPVAPIQTAIEDTMNESKKELTWKHRDGGISTSSSHSHEELDRLLDQALEDTFPASDPVSISISAGNR